jgi:(p)ppGpp synthase/HD superfamily hydrolase
VTDDLSSEPRVSTLGVVAPMTVSGARDLAASLFDGVVDKGGQPYIGHLERVSAALEELGATYQIAGLLHDAIEDTTYSGQDLLDEGVPYEAVRLVQIVTRHERESYMDFIHRIALHRDAIPLKVADILDNLDPDRVAGESLRGRYHKALVVLFTAWMKGL